MDDYDGTHLFKVRGRHEDGYHGRLMREPSAEAAAIAYVEHLPFVVEQYEVGVVVRDIQTGHEHSYLIHLDPGEPPEIV